MKIMAILTFDFLFLVFIFVSINENVKAFNTPGVKEVAPVVSTVTDTLAPVTTTVQLPIKSPLPNVGTTACSTYPHADKGIENFQKLCYTQMSLGPNQYFPYKCRKSRFTVGVSLENCPFEIPKVLSGLTPQVGFAIADFVNKTNSSQHFTYNYTFVEAQTAEVTYAYTDAANLSVIMTGVIPSYTDKGYVFLICKVDNLTMPLCSTPLFVFVCTYAQLPPFDDVIALAEPLEHYPYWFGKSLVNTSQIGCEVGLI